MANQCFWFLEDVDIKSMMDKEKMKAGRQMPGHRELIFKKGDAIYMPKEASDKIYFILEGRVKIGSFNDEGKEVTKIIIGSGEIFGELALVGEERRRDHAVAMEKTTICMMTMAEVQMLMKEHSAIGMFFMKLMGNRALDIEKRLESLVFRDSRTRIVEFLLDMADKKGQRVGYETVIRKFLTHQDIANMTATSRQTVTTVLNDLRTKNLLTFNRKRLLIRDLEKLAAEKVV